MPDAVHLKPNLSPAAEMGALNAAQVVAKLAQLNGWQLDGDGTEVAIEKRFRFPDFDDCIRFVNALNWIVRRLHHPPVRLSIEPDRQVLVRWSTPEAGGLSGLDFEAAWQVDALSG